MITREAIVAEARSWIGTRWLHQASLKGKGCDCIGLVAGVARNVGIPEALQFQRDIRYQGYGRTPDSRLLREAVSKYLEPTEDPQPGDVILMRFDAEPQHFGILSKRDYMIHALALARKVAEHRIDDAWASRIVSYHAFRGVA